MYSCKQGRCSRTSPRQPVAAPTHSNDARTRIPHVYTPSSRLLRRDGLDVEDGAEEVLDDGGLALLAGLLDGLDLLVGLLGRLVLGLLVAPAMLRGG